MKVPPFVIHPLVCGHLRYLALGDNATVLSMVIVPNYTSTSSV